MILQVKKGSDIAHKKKTGATHYQAHFLPLDKARAIK